MGEKLGAGQREKGKNEMRPVNYMDAFLVIKRKGDWLQVIQYDPAILKNGRLKEWKPSPGIADGSTGTTCC